ncbi:glycosyl transferase family 2 [Lactobacillus sp. CBA3606]|uniref:glycosyltransferase family 2 protein n=1 Tax=Lactobacillus sp. CBA3606 TaxID=2099789 RepID=UPI000CFB84BD|nr:glycosyltransferase [Lactobacillus sp. CBA3606]AVK63048.1 glycosyl transferase family 2 [Lactobacillus sp. CBA3606]
MKIIMGIGITISSLFYLYFLLDIILMNHYREPVQPTTKGAAKFNLYLVIPVLNEDQIIAKTVSRLSAQLAKLPATIHAQIITVDDNSTDNSLATLAASKSPYLQVLHRAGNDQQGKGAVINTAIQYLAHTLVKGTAPEQNIIGILDADAFMSSADLIQVVARFERTTKLAMLQTGVNIYNQTNWLTRMQDFEFIGVNSATQQLRERLGQGIASGNGQFVRLPLALKNPWGNSLLEDLEFTLRTWLLGGQVEFTHTIVVQQEAVAHLRPFFKQRVRWCQGALQCMYYLPAIWRSAYVNWFQKIDTTFWILMPITGCLVPLASLITLITLISRSLQDWTGGWHHLAIITILLIALLSCALLAVICQRNYADIHQKLPFWRAMLTSIGFQGYLLIIAVTPYAAIYRQLVGKTSWTKTRHEATPVYSHLKRSY